MPAGAPRRCSTCFAVRAFRGREPSLGDIRAAQQMSVLANLPVVALSTLVAFNVIQPTLPVALVFGAAVTVIDRLGWRVVSAMFDPERLITSTR